MELVNLAALACPRCYGVQIYRDRSRDVLCCAACGLVTSDVELANGYGVLWRRAGVMAGLGRRPSSTTRAACPTCYQIDKLTFAGTFVQCNRCRATFPCDEMAMIPEALAFDYRDPSGALVTVVQLPRPKREPTLDKEAAANLMRTRPARGRRPEEPLREVHKPGKRRIKIE